MKERVWEIVHSYLAGATPEQWHIYAAKSNYGDNQRALRWLVDNPDVDRATALMIYWNSGAEWNTQFDEHDDVSPAQRECMAMQRTIEARYPAFYANHAIWFDPKCSDGTRPGEYAHVIARRAIPVSMCEAVAGSGYVDTENPDGYDDGLPLDVAQRLYDLYE